MKCCAVHILMGFVATWLVVSCQLAVADISYAPVTWGSGGDLLGWTNQGGDANSVTSPATGGNPGGFLAINFAEAYSVMESNVVANSGPGYTGDYRSRDLALKFDFFGYQSSLQQLFFVSSADGRFSTWKWVIPEPLVDQQWQTYSVSFQDQGSWYVAGGDTNVNFLDALAQVDSIGLTVSHMNLGNMQYGLDNWQFSVPEPGETAMAAVLLLTMAFWGQRALRARRVGATISPSGKYPV